MDKSAQNKADPIPTQKPDTNPSTQSADAASLISNQDTKTRQSQILQPDPPHNSELFFVCITRAKKKFYVIHNLKFI